MSVLRYFKPFRIDTNIHSPPSRSWVATVSQLSHFHPVGNSIVGSLQVLQIYTVLSLAILTRVALFLMNCIGFKNKMYRAFIKTLKSTVEMCIQLAALAPWAPTLSTRPLSACLAFEY